jgi:hypothetical protein
MARLFEHLFSNGEQRRQNHEFKRGRRIDVNGEIELGRLLDRDIAGLCPNAEFYRPCRRLVGTDVKSGPYDMRPPAST